MPGFSTGDRPSDARVRCSRTVAAGLLVGLLVMDLVRPSPSPAVTIHAGAEIVVASTSTDVFPHVAMDSDGQFLVVWSDQGNVFARRYAPDGTPMGGQFTVNTITSAPRGSPDVAYIPTPQGQASTGLAAIVWTAPDSDQSGLAWNLFDSANQRVFPGQDVLLNSNEAGSQHSPSVTANDSMIVVAWQYNDLTGAYLHGRRFDTSGTALGMDQVFVGNPNSASPDVSVDPSGHFVTVGSCFNCSGPMTFEEIIAERRDPSGNPFGGEFIVNGFSIDNQRFPRVQSAPNGDYLVTWDNGDQAMPRFQLFSGSTGKKLSCPGDVEPCELLAAEVPMGPPPLFKPIHLDPAMSRDGSFVTVFETFVSGPGARIDGMAFHPDGSTEDADEIDANTKQFVVHDSLAEGVAARNPRVASSGLGRHVVVYDRTDGKVVARLFRRPSCGDPDGDGRTTASEALLALRTAVGAAGCPLCLCDLDGSGDVMASNALFMLRAAVGIPTAFFCPLCP